MLFLIHRHYSLSVVQLSLSLKGLSDVVLLTTGDHFLKLRISFEISKTLKASGVSFVALLVDYVNLFSHCPGVTTAGSKRMDEALLNNACYLLIEGSPIASVSHRSISLPTHSTVKYRFVGIGELSGFILVVRNLTLNIISRF
jgi:hypothetical protein